MSTMHCIGRWLAPAETAYGKNAVRQILAEACATAGSMSAWARANGIPVSTVSETVSGKREPSEAIANALGLVRLVVFRKIAKAGAE